jgi:hypothetical protein
MTTALDQIDANLASLRTWAEEGKPLPFIDEGHDFVVGPPMEEVELQAIERRFAVALPPEYRSFLARFGDTSIGPGNPFRRVNKGLTPRSKNRFPLEKPFLGTLSPRAPAAPPGTAMGGLWSIAHAMGTDIEGRRSPCNQRLRLRDLRSLDS